MSPAPDDREVSIELRELRAEVAGLRADIAALKALESRRPDHEDRLRSVELAVSQARGGLAVLLWMAPAGAVTAVASLLLTAWQMATHGVTP